MIHNHKARYPIRIAYRGRLLTIKEKSEDALKCYREYKSACNKQPPPKKKKTNVLHDK